MKTGNRPILGKQQSWKIRFEIQRFVTILSTILRHWKICVSYRCYCFERVMFLHAMTTPCFIEVSVILTFTIISTYLCIPFLLNRIRLYSQRHLTMDEQRRSKIVVAMLLHITDVRGHKVILYCSNISLHNHFCARNKTMHNSILSFDEDDIDWLIGGKQHRSAEVIYWTLPFMTQCVKATNEEYQTYV